MQIVERGKASSATNTYGTEAWNWESIRKESFAFGRSGSSLGSGRFNKFVMMALLNGVFLKMASPLKRPWQPMSTYTNLWSASNSAGKTILK